MPEMRLLLIGRGRMGRLVDALSPEFGCEIAGRLDSSNNAGGAGIRAECRDSVDVAIDFSTATAFVETFPKLAALGINVVVGTTGWQAQESEMRRVAADTRIGVVAAANFSPGVALFAALAEQAARLFPPGDFGAWIHEAHHAAKRDAPSGTALVLKSAMERGGYSAGIDLASTRAGSIPGIHTIGFDSAAETVTLSHTVRDRSTFARGALRAARWVQGKQGWFTMKDVLGLRLDGSGSF